MQIKAVSLVTIAVWLAGAVDASAVLAARVAPAPDAALATVIIKPLSSSTSCLTSNGASGVILSNCNGASSQIWAVNEVDGTTYQFQNAASNNCLANTGTAVGQLACINSANNSPFSGSEWAASQDISQARLPLALTGLDSHLNFIDSGFCMAQSGSALTLARCNGGLPQSWVLSAA